MTEVRFYHLRRQPPERALPALLERSLERGWRAVVQIASEERLAVIDDVLWTYADESFLAHGTAREGDPEAQPVYLTTGPENPNGAQVRFFLEGSEALQVLGSPEAAVYERAVVLFDGNDPDAVTAARAQWQALKEAGHAVSYWQQSDGGSWEQKA